MTGIDMLKNWFKSGLKPTQEQFWEWMDSFWHKEEKIPMAQIEGIDTALQNKADTEQLQHKVNSDASGLNEENVISWKTVLGVGELPTNIATIDEQDKTGNVHTKEQIRELLETSGKNLSNSDLIIPSGEVRTLDTTGAKFLIKGLQNRKNESAFNLRVKANDRGELAVSDEADIKLIIPDNFESKITFNHIYPSPIPERQSFSSDIEEILRNYKNIDFKILDKSDFLLKNNEASRDESDKSIINNDGEVKIVKNNTLYSKYLFPSNKDWVLEIHGEMSNDNVEIGIGRDDIEFGMRKVTTNYGYGRDWRIIKTDERTLWGSGDVRGSKQPTLSKLIFIKKGNLLVQASLLTNKLDYEVFNGNTELGDFRIIAKNNSNNFKAKYKILN